MHFPDQSARLNCMLWILQTKSVALLSVLFLFLFFCFFARKKPWQRWPELFQLLEPHQPKTNTSLFVSCWCVQNRPSWWSCEPAAEAETAVLTCWLHLILWTLSLTLLTGEGSWETHSGTVDYFLPCTSSAPLWVECDNLGVVEPVCSLCRADPSPLWFHGRFSCVNPFVLFWHVPARGSILVSVSSAVCPLCFKHIGVTRGW